MSLSKIKSIKKIKKRQKRYDIKVNGYSCYFANGIKIHNTDGQNLMFTVKDDGKIYTARNKGHLKNYGENAMTPQELASKFKGRGGLEIAYNNAIIDLQKAFSKLSKKELTSMFMNGKKFMSMEVMHVDSENVVSYGSNQLRFHGTKEFNIDGLPIDDNKKDGDKLAQLIKDVHQEKQNTFTIYPLEVAKLEKLPDFDKKRTELIKQLDSIIKPYKLKDSDKLNDYKKKYWEKILRDKGVYNKELLNRWAFDDKTYKIVDIKRDFSGKDLKWILDFDKKQLKDEWKNMMLPFEHLFLKLGATVLKGLRSFMVINPDETIRKMKNNLDSVIKKIEATKDPKLLKKLQLELGRLEAAGGIDMIAPEEGITFMYDGEFLKLTGNFAATNQLMGMSWQL